MPSISKTWGGVHPQDPFSLAYPLGLGKWWTFAETPSMQEIDRNSLFIWACVKIYENMYCTSKSHCWSSFCLWKLLLCGIPMNKRVESLGCNPSRRKRKFMAAWRCEMHIASSAVISIDISWYLLISHQYLYKHIQLVSFSRSLVPIWEVPKGEPTKCTWHTLMKSKEMIPGIPLLQV